MPAKKRYFGASKICFMGRFEVIIAIIKLMTLYIKLSLKGSIPKAIPLFQIR